MKYIALSVLDNKMAWTKHSSLKQVFLDKVCSVKIASSMPTRNVQRGYLRTVLGRLQGKVILQRLVCCDIINR